ncbi:hypothetical protein EDC45_1376 [Mesocricetibacter intestinalis]|uniref:Uncharacterized protein n=1 Tax=Mesocricetibacter intestinalis TaxID=1521930 RepID=A0A4R6VHL3_9PAST|nr:hypothetical protein [Mesocricetibacter intestinalis]TDQ57728.1 hypothetical protein EDC45_1376 [Mesocricetibacter intestinalis]
MKLKQLIKPPPAEGYIKNSSRLVTFLFVLAGLLYYLSEKYGGYAAIIVLSIALMVLMGQKMLISQADKDFKDMYFARRQFESGGNPDYLRFIQARGRQILQDNKVLSEKGKTELQALLNYAELKLAEVADKKGDGKQPQQ